MAIINFFMTNWVYFATILWAVSELLALNPNIKSNSIFELVYNFLSKFRQ